MIQVLVLVSLVIGAVLYALLIRRRGGARLISYVLASEMTSSNAIAVARVNDAARRRVEAGAQTRMNATANAIEAPHPPPGLGGPVGLPEGMPDRRSGGDRRGRAEGRRGRGRRTGAERRRSNAPWRP